MDHSQEQLEETQGSTSAYSQPERNRPVTTNGGLDPFFEGREDFQATQLDQNSSPAASHPFNYDFIETIACVAIYDTLQSTPQIIQIPGAPTHQFIENIASTTYNEAKNRGGLIPYTVIREVAENFIHANFNEPVVSIFDHGNTIRFADQGPGIKDKERAQEPGFTSASEPMKKYIRGVGSGLPLVKEVLSFSHGTIKIEDNINQGSVITISLLRDLSGENTVETDDIPSLTENDRAVLKALLPHKQLRLTDVRNTTGLANASIYAAFTKLENAGIIESSNKKRQLTDKGIQVALSL